MPLLEGMNLTLTVSMGRRKSTISAVGSICLEMPPDAKVLKGNVLSKYINLESLQNLRMYHIGSDLNTCPPAGGAAGIGLGGIGLLNGSLLLGIGFELIWVTLIPKQKTKISVNLVIYKYENSIYGSIVNETKFWYKPQTLSPIIPRHGLTSICGEWTEIYKEDNN